MTKKRFFRNTLGALITTLSLGIITETTASADEGMWLPSLISERIVDMQSKGFKLSAEDIYSVNQASLKDAVVLFGRGCTGEGISPEGLLLTNHHCGYGAIQRLSSVEHDYLTDGFWAQSREEELPNENLNVKFLKRMEDITERLAAGESREEILGKARENGCDAMLLTALDEIAWTLNLRGNDVECNPVFVSYLLLSDRQNVLFVNPAKVSDEVREHLSLSGVETMPYTAVADAVKNLHACRTMISNKTNCAIKSLFNDGECVIMPSIAEEMKAVKNSAEIAGFHSAMLRDGVAMVTFLSRLKSEVKKGITEMGMDRLLTSLRAEQELYRGLSFATIAAYGAHGAIVHYEADEHSDVKLEPHGFILIDSGAQYSDGTTDITRTISLGNPTEEEKKIYTLVLKGHIALSECVFPDGASGTQIDCAARYAMWQHFLNYGHGTGHGVGSYLNVHEGPHQIRMNYMPAPLRAGMTVTDEPGIYCEGKFGVRTENTLLIVPAGESQFGKFLKFEPLTLCPIDTTPIDLRLMTDKELQWLNDYHETVRQRLTPLIKDGAVKEWLADATKPISR